MSRQEAVYRRPTAKIGVGNSQFGRFAGEVVLRGNVVEDAVVTKCGQIERGGREHVGFANGGIARVVDEGLIAAESIAFGEGRRGRAARRVDPRLIVAKSSEGIVAGGKRLVEKSRVPKLD